MVHNQKNSCIEPTDILRILEGPSLFFHWTMIMGERSRKGTSLKFNMEPENGGLEDDFPFHLAAF